MATTTNGIATWDDIYNRVGNKQAFWFLDYQGEDRKRCPTKQEIEGTGRITVHGDYAYNQCVKYSDLEFHMFNLTIRITEEVPGTASIENIKFGWVDSSGTKQWTSQRNPDGISGTEQVIINLPSSKEIFEASQFCVFIGSTGAKRKWYYGWYDVVNNVWYNDTYYTNYDYHAEFTIDASMALAREGIGVLCD